MRIANALLAVSLVVAPLSLSAQTAPQAGDTPQPAPETSISQPGDTPKFEISRFVVEGNTLLTGEEVDKSVAPYAGADKDFADVQRALEALQAAYQDAGYGAVQVVLPEQVLDQGVVRFRVIEAKVRKITVEEAKFHSEANVRAGVPALKEGETPRLRDIASQLRVGNENPSKQTTLLMKTGEQEGEVDATLKVADAKTQKAFVSLDNTGSKESGDYRLGVGYQHANVRDRDDLFTFQYITSPESNADDVTVVGAGYRIPIYPWSGSLELIAGYSDVRTINVQNLFDATGKGTIFGARYNQFLPKVKENYEHRISLGLDYRAFEADVQLVGGVAVPVPDITLHPVSLTYSGNLQLNQAEAGFFVSAARNISGGNDGGSSDFASLRAAADANYAIIRYGANYSRVFSGDWQLRAILLGQYTEDALVAYEQFGAGGADSVRGFKEREFFNDKGYRAMLEAYTPGWTAALAGDTLRLRGLVFYDFAQLSRNDALPGEIREEYISSVGFGLRLALGENLSARLDVAQVLHPGPVNNPAFGSIQGKNDSRAHFGVAYVHSF